MILQKDGVRMSGIGRVDGESIILCLMTEENKERYLQVYKTSSNFADLYRTSAELWKSMSDPMGTDTDDTVRYLIYEKDSERVCGYINYDLEEGLPSIDIAIVPEYRQSGYGYDAAKTLCEELLSKEWVETVIWHVMPNNTPSIKIAEKLGGEQIDGKNIIAEALANAFGKDVAENSNIPKTLTYAIRRPL